MGGGGKEKKKVIIVSQTQLVCLYVFKYVHVNTVLNRRSSTESSFSLFDSYSKHVQTIIKCGSSVEL